MTPLDHTSERAWFKSSRSADNAACVEVRMGGGVVDVRDTKNRGGPVLSFDAVTWAGFLSAVKADAVDLP